MAKTSVFLKVELHTDKRPPASSIILTRFSKKVKTIFVFSHFPQKSRGFYTHRTKKQEKF